MTSRLRLRTGPLVAAILAATLLLVGRGGPPPPVAADSAVSGTVTAGGSPVPGALVAFVGTADSDATVTGADGTYSLELPDGTYTVTAQAPGYAVTTVSGVAVSGATTRDLALTASGATFEALPVFGAQASGLFAGGQPGEFYMVTSVVPQVFRTLDYGGTWTPATVAFDDPANGLDKTNNLMGGRNLATSGYPGEVAVLMGGGEGWKVYYSRDFGVTWSAADGTMNSAGFTESGTLAWGHAGTTSVLVASDGSNMWYADMSATTPSVSQMTTPYAASGELYRAANGTTAPYIAVAATDGGVTIYPLTATATPGAGSSIATGISSPNWFGFGGAGSVPSALVIGSGATMRMALKSTSASAFAAGDLSAQTTTTCQISSDQPTGVSVTPAAGDGAGSAFVSSCQVVFEGAGDPLTAQHVNGSNGTMVHDPGWDGVDNLVVLAMDGGYGVVKAASLDGGVPYFPQGKDASAGVSPNSGGRAVNGITVPVVKDVAYGTSALEMAIATGGGKMSIASANGGRTWKLVVDLSSAAAAWWQGASGKWLMFGHGGAGDLLSAFKDWTPSSASTAAPNLASTGSADMGFSDPSIVTAGAIVGVPGFDMVFIGASTGNSGPGGFTGGTGRVLRATLAGSGTPTITFDSSFGSGSPFSDGALVTTGSVQALAYCPETGSADSVKDVLFVAFTENGSTDGGLYRVTDATGSGSAASLATWGEDSGSVNANDVAVSCSTGRAWVGGGNNAGGPKGGLYRSDDGGATFSLVSNVPGNLNVQAVTVNPANPDEIILAANSEGFIYRTTDGGTNWAVVNSPYEDGGRSFMSEGVGELALPPAPASSGAGPVAGLTAPAGSGKTALLVGSGGGAFSATVSSSSTRPALGAGKPGNPSVFSKDTIVAGFRLKWRRVANATAYQVKIVPVRAGTSCRTKATAAFTARGGTRTATALPKAVRSRLKKGVLYTWCIRARAGSTAGAYTAPTFVPTLRQPADRARKQARTTLFRWTPIPGARSYLLQVSTDSRFPKAKTTTFITGAARYTLPARAALEASKKYFWRVAPAGTKRGVPVGAFSRKSWFMTRK